MYLNTTWWQVATRNSELPNSAHYVIHGHMGLSVKSVYGWQSSKRTPCNASEIVLFSFFHWDSSSSALIWMMSQYFLLVCKQFTFKSFSSVACSLKWSCSWESIYTGHWGLTCSLDLVISGFVSKLAQSQNNIMVLVLQSKQCNSVVPLSTTSTWLRLSVSKCNNWLAYFPFIGI